MYKKRINVIVKRWLDKVNGNTYHSVMAIIPGINGEKGEVLCSSAHYGYSSQYLVTLHDLLLAHDYCVPNSYFDWVRDANLNVFDIDVKSRKAMEFKDTEVGFFLNMIGA